MPARDTTHQVVRAALEREGWIITADPLEVSFGGVALYIDLGADRLLEAKKDNQRIAVEIKAFIATSFIYEFHTVLGQFLNYKLALQKIEPERIFYLAVPADVYDTFFILPFIQLQIDNYQMKLIIYDVEQGVILQWLE